MAIVGFMKKHKAMTLGLGAVIATLLLTNISCRILMPTNEFLAHQAYKDFAQGRGYDSYQAFLDRGLRIDLQGTHDIWGTNSAYIYFVIQDPKNNQIGHYERVVYYLTACGCTKEILTMTHGISTPDEDERFLDYRGRKST